MATLREEMQAIYDQYQHLTPKLVFEVAKETPNSALHSHVFHIDVDEAAERYYLDRCGDLIRKIKIRRVAGDRVEPYKVRAYHAVQTPKGSVYKSTDDIIEDDFQRQLVLQNMEREWRTLMKKYETFSEFVAMVRRDLGEVA